LPSCGTMYDTTTSCSMPHVGSMLVADAAAVR
jgi:hypothetical protein